MSGTTIIASALPMAVLCTSIPEPGHDPDYQIALVGERDPAALHGVGITYGVDVAAFNEWIALNAGLATLVRPTDQAEIDSWTSANSVYGWEDALAAGGTLATNASPFQALLVARAATDPRTLLEVASEQRRQAEVQLRLAEAMRREADQSAEAAIQARDQAEEAQRQAMAMIAEQDAKAPPPPPAAEPQPAP